MRQSRPVAGGGAVVHVQDHVAAAGEQGVEHELAKVGGPALVGILQVARAVHEDDGGPGNGDGFGGQVEPGVNRAIHVS